MGITDRCLRRDELLRIFAARVVELPFEDEHSKAIVVHAARVLLLSAVVETLFEEGATFSFRTDFGVTWTTGYFLQK